MKTEDMSTAADENVHSSAPPAVDSENIPSQSTSSQPPSSPALSSWQWYVPEPLRAPELAPPFGLSSSTSPHHGRNNRYKAKDLYWDRSYYESHEAQIAALKKSSTLYVGNLAFTTLTRQIHAHFRPLGPIKMVHLGLDRIRKTPCGFCFVEYEKRSHALQAVSFLSGTKLDGNIIRVELDAGYQQGRELGRGAKGGQTRHDRKPPPSFNDNNNSNNNNNYYGGGPRKRPRYDQQQPSRNPPPPPPPPQQQHSEQTAGASTVEDSSFSTNPNPVDSYTPSAPSDPADTETNYYENRENNNDNNYNDGNNNDYYSNEGDNDGDDLSDQPPNKRQRT